MHSCENATHLPSYSSECDLLSIITPGPVREALNQLEAIHSRSDLIINWYFLITQPILSTFYKLNILIDVIDSQKYMDMYINHIIIWL